MQQFTTCYWKDYGNIDRAAIDMEDLLAVVLLQLFECSLLTLVPVEEHPGVQVPLPNMLCEKWFLVRVLKCTQCNPNL